jgi:hypothetical protein
MIASQQWWLRTLEIVIALSALIFIFYIPSNQLRWQREVTRQSVILDIIIQNALEFKQELTKNDLRLIAEEVYNEHGFERCPDDDSSFTAKVYLPRNSSPSIENIIFVTKIYKERARKCSLLDSVRLSGIPDYKVIDIENFDAATMDVFAFKKKSK